MSESKEWYFSVISFNLAKTKFSYESSPKKVKYKMDHMNAKVSLQANEVSI